MASRAYRMVLSKNEVCGSWRGSHILTQRRHRCSSAVATQRAPRSHKRRGASSHTMVFIPWPVQSCAHHCPVMARLSSSKMCVMTLCNDDGIRHLCPIQLLAMQGRVYVHICALYAPMVSKHAVAAAPILRYAIVISSVNLLEVIVIYTAK
jgi:hypothetical protein